MNISFLEYALIGLLFETPQSGYALRKTFETTPMGHFSSSPGSIYPALKRLQAKGLLERKAQSPRSKALYCLTSEGKRSFHVWVTRPVSREDVADNMDGVLLRFAFLQNIPETRATLNFLVTLDHALRAHIDHLEHYLQSEHGQGLSQHGRLAVRNGILGFQAHLEWSALALKTFNP